MKTGTKELLGKAINAKGLTISAKMVPLAGNAISFVSNLGEFTDPANSNKSIAEKTGRWTFGFGADMVMLLLPIRAK
ncbi:hypothetical protein ACFWDG_01765 [Peribacillus sp. NPDC060186]